MILAISGSPSSRSRTGAVLARASSRLLANGHTVRRLFARDLPAGPLLAADLSHPAISAATELIAEADGLVVATPIYQAAYTGLLKSLFDLLPRHALAGKTVLPLATGGTTAHLLALDNALRPVLVAMGARHVLPGYFVLDQLVTLAEDSRGEIEPDAGAALTALVDRFSEALGRAPALALAP